MGRGLRALLAVLWVGLAGLAWAAEWGGIVPGETTLREVERLYGRPTRERTVSEEGRAAPEWTYTGERAPRGLERMVVSFGLFRGDTFSPGVVRSLTLHPKPRIFEVNTIVNGWGKPDAIGTEERSGRPAFRYETLGLVVVFDPTGQWVEVMLFAPARPAP